MPAYFYGYTKPDSDEPILDEGRQLHVTLYKPRDGGRGVEVYAHEEYDWQVHPILHYRSVDFRPRYGAKLMGYLIDEHTYLVME